MIYHLALAADWQRALAEGEYRMSTLGVPLAEQGFVHASFAHQVQGVADAVYADVHDPVVLLAIDEHRLGVPWRVDPVPASPGASPGASPEGFPHVYGAVPASAVVWARAVARGADGRLDVGLPGEDRD